MALTRSAAVTGALVFGLTAPAFAGSVTGTVTVPADAGGKRPLTKMAYLTRIENPLVPVKAVDPMPHLVVVLEKDGLELPTAPVADLTLLGESFDRPLLPVVAGTKIALKNLKVSRKHPTLYVDGMPDLLPETPFNPGATRDLAVGAEGGKLLALRAKESTTLGASILVLSTPYFAVPDSAGKYSIPNVKEGEYKVRVWYKDGWVEGADTTVKVDAKDGASLKLDLKSLTTAAPAAPPDEPAPSEGGE